MSIIHAVENLKENDWSIQKKDISSHYADLQIGFTSDTKVVEFNDLEFGFELRCKNVVIDEKKWPPENVRYRSTDQSYLVSHRLTLSPDLDYELYVWAKERGVFSDMIIEFSTKKEDHTIGMV